MQRRMDWLRSSSALTAPKSECFHAYVMYHAFNLGRAGFWTRAWNTIMFNPSKHADNTGGDLNSLLRLDSSSDIFQDYLHHAAVS